MSSIIKPRIPQIDHDNPLARGLVFDAPFFDFGNTPLDIINKIKGSIATPFSYINSPWGKAIDFAPGLGAGNATWTTPSKVNSLKQMSIEIMFTRTGGIAGYPYLFFKGPNPANSNYVIIQNDNGDTGWGIVFGSNYATTAGRWSVPYPPVNTWTHYIWTYDISSVSNNPLCYINGLPATVTTRATPSGSLPTDGTALSVGGVVGLSKSWEGNILYARVWNRILTPTDAKILYQNPFRIYKAPARIVVANTSTSTITTKTQTGVSRIQVLTAKIISGITRITAVTIKTQSAITRIQEQVNKTIAGLARVTAMTLKTISAISRITAVTIRTTTAISRIAAIVNKTINSVARITALTQKIISGTARITVISIKNQTGKTRVQAAGKTYVDETMATSPSTGTIGGNTGDTAWNSNGYLVLTQATNNEHGYIDYTGTLPNSFETDFDIWMGPNNSGADAIWFYFGTSAIPTSEDESLGGYIIAFDEYSGDNAPYQIQFNGTRLANTSGASPFSDSAWHKAKIVVNGTTITIFLDGAQVLTYTDIARTFSGTHFGVAARTGGVNNEHSIRNLAIYGSEGVTHGLARIQQVVNKTQTGIAHIGGATAQTTTGKTRILVIQMRTIIGKANLFVATIKTITAKASVKATTTQTIASTAHIKSAYGLYRKISQESIYAGKSYNTLGSLFYNV